MGNHPDTPTDIGLTRTYQPKTTPDITPTHPDTGSGPGPGLGYQLVHDLDALMAQTSRPRGRRTAVGHRNPRPGRRGVPPPGSPIQPAAPRSSSASGITPPADILRLIRALARPGLTLVGHNLTFDLAKLIHLATVASILAERGQGWTSRRPSGRQSPSAARAKPPLRTDSSTSRCSGPTGSLTPWSPPTCCPLRRRTPGATLHHLPQAAGRHRAGAGGKTSGQPEQIRRRGGRRLGVGQPRPNGHGLGDTPKPTAAEKRRRPARHQVQGLSGSGRCEDHHPRPEPLQPEDPGPLLGYTGPVQKQDFEGIFGDADTASPVWLERGGPSSKECGHQDAWQKSLKPEADETHAQLRGR